MRRALALIALVSCVHATSEPQTFAFPRESDDLIRIAADARVVERLLARKRAERDVVSVLCLNDKLVQIATARRSVRTREAALRVAVEQRDDVAAARERSWIALLGKRADALTSEALRCV